MVGSDTFKVGMNELRLVLKEGSAIDVINELRFNSQFTGVAYLENEKEVRIGGVTPKEIPQRKVEEKYKRHKAQNMPSLQAARERLAQRNMQIVETTARKVRGQLKRPRRSL